MAPRSCAPPLAALVLLIAAPAAAQTPEDRGPLAFGVWDAGGVQVDGVSLHTVVYHPQNGGPYPLVGVIHGANSNNTYHVELASTLASRGFVAVVPDMPCTVISCDHDANQRQISALLEWATAQGQGTGSPLAGRVDGSRRGLIGHSWGGLSSHITAARDSSIDSLVLFDPNDDGVQGLSVTPTIAAPTLQLLAEVPGLCNSAWQEANVRPQLVPPNLQVTVNGSGHCDPGEQDLVCSFACGAGDRATVPLFRRWAVAWTACVLAADPAMTTWVGGAELDAAIAAGTLEGVQSKGLDQLPCAVGSPGTGGGGGGAGTGGAAGGGAAGGAAPGDAGADAATSAGAGGAGATGAAGGAAAGSAGAPGAGGSGDEDSGCACRAQSRSPRGAALAGVGLLLAWAARRRRAPRAPW
ncbi:MAG: dienelactone hydrolase family protein [Polyangiaceae bacterium]|nr:dienelactone hydrolase family protein [Polyangiaceae bacterium]